MNTAKRSGADLTLPAIAVGILLQAGCAPYVATCEYVELHPSPGLRVVNSAHHYGECFRLSHSVPVKYELQRSAYTVTIVNSDRWYAELALEVRGRRGVPPTIQSDLVRASSSRLEVRGESFRYFVRPTEAAGKKVRFSIVGTDGRVLGTDELAFSTQHATMIGVEGL